MSVFRVSTAYAKSIITLAQEQNLLDQVYEDMILTCKIGNDSVELRNLLLNPIISPVKKVSIIEAIFQNKVNNLTFSFFKLIAKKGRESLLLTIASAYIDEYKILKGIQTASIVTAVEIDDNTKQSIKEILTTNSESVEFSFKVDESLIGGFILNTKGNQIDASVRNKLNSIKKQFKINPYISK